MDSFVNKVRNRSGAISMAAATVVSLLAFQSAAVAADVVTEKATMEEVIITGTSIAQSADMSALPVTTLTSEDIAKTGLSNATELLQSMPAMQGFVAASQSVNGGGGGGTTAALHSLPSKYTLVLLDGQRVAPFGVTGVAGGGSAVNLESIPLEAIERVEVLTDGASALYGADAIAGVVNFVLKKNRNDGNVFYHVSVPQASGGGGWNAGFSKGFGDLNADGFNLLLTYSHDVQDKLQASQRAASKRGVYFQFADGGKNYVMFNSTSNTEPANVILNVNSTFDANGNILVNGNPSGAPESYNPYYAANKNCGSKNAAPLTDSTGALTCRFNYAATVQDIPSSIRDSGVLKGTLRINDNNDVWATVMISDYSMLAQYAPPAQPLRISPTVLPTLYNAYVLPYITANNIDAPTATLGYRAVSAGGRTDSYETDTRHISLGWDGKAGEWDLKAALIVSHGKFTDTLAGGYLDYDLFSAAVNSGAYDPVSGTGASAIKPAIARLPYSWTNSDVNSLTFDAQHKVLDLEGGASILSLGAEYVQSKYTVNYAEIALTGSGYSTQPSSTDRVVGGAGGAVPYASNRDNWGAFAEWLLPFKNNLSVTASVRYDSYAKTHSDWVFGTSPDSTGLIPQLPGADLGNTFNDTTGKVSFRWTPLQMLSVRGSVGTGFRAPNMTDIAGPVVFNGSTSNSYPCPFPGTSGCIPGSAQYDLLLGPNGASGEAGLKPEKSTQWTFGVIVDPVPGLTLGVDYWNVEIKDQVLSQGIAEQVAFANPQQYAALFVNPYTDPVGGFTTIGFTQAPFNGGTAKYSGLDWNFAYRVNTGLGKFSAVWAGTEMLTQEYNFGEGEPFLTDLGKYGPDQSVVFKTRMQLVLSLQHGKFTESLTAHYLSGYDDQPYAAADEVIFLANADGTPGAPVDFTLSVPSQTTLDFQSNLSVNDHLDLTVGVHNLTNEEPPLSLQSGGGGNQGGYDGRYYDPIGRAYYFRGSYKF